MDLNKLKTWFASVEGKQSLNDFAKKQQAEKKYSKTLEERSNLAYPNGQKVQRGDLFIDLGSKARYESKASSEPYGYFRYVHRINEDESIDVCFDANIALKMNDYVYDFNTAELVERNAKLFSPLDDLLK